MTRQSRTLLVMAVLAVAAVVALALMANRYRRFLEARVPRQAPSAARGPADEALRRVDAFLAARAGVEDSPPAEEALKRAGLDRAEYEELSRALRRWRAGDPTLDPYLRSAFDRRRGRLGAPSGP